MEFLSTVARLWRCAAIHSHAASSGTELATQAQTSLHHWAGQAQANFDGLLRLLDAVKAYRLPTPSADHDSMIDYDRVRQVMFVAMEFAPQDGSDAWMTPLAHRQFYPQELEALLHYNGFTISESHCDFFRSPLVSSSRTILLHCRPRRSA